MRSFSVLVLLKVLMRQRKKMKDSAEEIDFRIVFFSSRLTDKKKKNREYCQHDRNDIKYFSV